MWIYIENVLDLVDGSMRRVMWKNGWEDLVLERSSDALFENRMGMISLLLGTVYAC